MFFPFVSTQNHAVSCTLSCIIQILLWVARIGHRVLETATDISQGRISYGYHIRYRVPSTLALRSSNLYLAPTEVLYDRIVCVRPDGRRLNSASC